GDDGRAVAFYRRAAAVLAANSRFLAAGDLLQTKAYLRDEAVRYYRHGWRNDGAEALACAERLVDDGRRAGERDAINGASPGPEAVLADRPRDAGRFFNYALRTAESFLPEDLRADYRDRARLHFAAHLRTHAMIGEAAALIGELFPVGSA